MDCRMMAKRSLYISVTAPPIDFGYAYKEEKDPDRVDVAKSLFGVLSSKSD